MSTLVETVKTLVSLPYIQGLKKTKPKSDDLGFVSECSEFIQDLKFLNPITMLVKKQVLTAFSTARYSYL